MRNNLYQDEIWKLSYYRNYIINELVKNGTLPDNYRINEKLDKIDAKLGLFQYEVSLQGEFFDADKFNNDMALIYEDLLILYKVAYELSIKRLEELRTYAETHLAQLEHLASEYEYKTRFELDSTFLGNTIFFQSSGFDMSGENGVARISLGNIIVREQSQLACIFEAPGVEVEDIVFSFHNPYDVTESYHCSPYAYNKDMFTVPGTLKSNSYEFTMSEDTNIRTSFTIDIPDLEPDMNSKYMLYGGKNFISIGYLDKKYGEKIPEVPFSMPAGNGVIDFWIVGGTFCDFEFNKEPASKNFSGISINNMDEHQHIVIEYTDGFIFNFTTDGICYATQREGIVTNGQLIYPAADQVYSVLVEEYAIGKEIEYFVQVTVNNLLYGELPRVEMIAIKELAAVEV